MLTREELLSRTEAITDQPVAIEASWDGDTTGWFVRLEAIIREKQGEEIRYKIIGIAFLPSDAQLASEVGPEIAARYGVPFYFASPDHPELDCPRWWEQELGYPCRRCGIPLLQPESCSYRGVCYECYLKEERERKNSTSS